MPPTQNTDAQPQQEQHVIASPGTIDDSKTRVVGPGKVSSTTVQPAVTTTAAPMKKKATRPKRRRKTTHND